MAQRHPHQRRAILTKGGPSSPKAKREARAVPVAPPSPLGEGMGVRVVPQFPQCGRPFPVGPGIFQRHKAPDQVRGGVGRGCATFPGWARFRAWRQGSEPSRQKQQGVPIRPRPASLLCRRSAQPSVELRTDPEFGAVPPVSCPRWPENGLGSPLRGWKTGAVSGGQIRRTGLSPESRCKSFRRP